MYAIRALSPADALEFLGLAPFEVRPVLEGLGGLPRVHVFGASLMGRPVGLGIAVRGWSAKGAFGGNAPEAGSGRVLSLTVARNYRRLGVGRALLSALEAALAEHGVETVECRYALPPGEGLNAIEALFHKEGWGAPDVTMVQCRADQAVLEAPMMREQIALPPEYELVDWVDLSEHDRAQIRSHQGAELWFPATLDPFHFEADLETLNSIALRYRGEVVGWLITRRTSPTTMYYRCLFVRTDLAKLGRGLALICEAIRRHHNLIGSLPGYGEWSTPTSMPAMVRFIRRHLAPYGARVIEQRLVRKTLGPEAWGLRPEARARVLRRGVSETTVLSPAECARALADVNALRERWVARAEPFAFHTLGAVAHIDAFDDADAYEATAVRVNPLLSQRFGWLYDRVFAALSAALGAPVEHRTGWALPAFHILRPSRGANLPLASIHCDVEHTYLEPGAVSEMRPVSFSVCLTRADANAGISAWDLGFDETVGLDTEEASRLLESVPVARHSMTEGGLLTHSGDTYHQSNALADLNPGTERVTLAGQAVFSAGRWVVFG